MIVTRAEESDDNTPQRVAGRVPGKLTLKLKIDVTALLLVRVLPRYKPLDLLLLLLCPRRRPLALLLVLVPPRCRSLDLGVCFLSEIQPTVTDGREESHSRKLTRPQRPKIGCRERDLRDDRVYTTCKVGGRMKVQR